MSGGCHQRSQANAAHGTDEQTARKRWPLDSRQEQHAQQQTMYGGECLICGNQPQQRPSPTMKNSAKMHAPPPFCRNIRTIRHASMSSTGCEAFDHPKVIVPRIKLGHPAPRVGLTAGVSCRRTFADAVASLNVPKERMQSTALLRGTCSVGEKQSLCTALKPHTIIQDKHRSVSARDSSRGHHLSGKSGTCARAGDIHRHHTPAAIYLSSAPSVSTVRADRSSDTPRGAPPASAGRARSSG